MRISDWSSDVCSSDLKIRARIDDVVTNQQAAEGLKPWYGMLCKRPTFHDDYLQAFNQPNVTLVDTQGRGPDRFTDTGLLFAGVEYPPDSHISPPRSDPAPNHAPHPAPEPPGHTSRPHHPP